jgi:hypothetical protein
MPGRVKLCWLNLHAGINIAYHVSSLNLKYFEDVIHKIRIQGA